MRQRFLCTRKQNFSWIQQILNNFPKDPIVKIAHFGNVMSIDMTLPNASEFYNGGLWVNYMSFVGFS